MKVEVFLFSLSLIHISKAFEPFINQNEMTVALDTLDQLDIHYCIFLSDGVKLTDVSPQAYQIKQISSQNMMSSFWNIKNFLDEVVLYRFKLSYHKKALVLKRLGQLEYFINHFRLHIVLKYYTWLLFDENINISIPYDCEFIIVQTKDKNIYKLSEIYSIKNQTFRNDFGTWDYKFGFDKSENRTFYWRRLNFNGSEIESVAFDYFPSKVCYMLMLYSILLN